ncbi:hypothetical protein ZIOFF_022443 [Zingiber officinale]|uniref:Uncharacterized protein n=1 Tax=Zingiber officinale TaxID=94328 RepID=A0A8J5LH78_ZINOF|nr:hypothetical protein ZIOFF_022443 [Zingiber officinale]
MYYTRGPILDPIGSLFHLIFCGRRSNSSSESRGYELDDSPLPGSDSIEANRRRERGARALEQRLATEKSSAVEKSDQAIESV